MIDPNGIACTKYLSYNACASTKYGFWFVDLDLSGKWSLELKACEEQAKPQEMAQMINFNIYADGCMIQILVMAVTTIPQKSHA